MIWIMKLFSTLSFLKICIKNLSLRNTNYIRRFSTREMRNVRCHVHKQSLTTNHRFLKSVTTYIQSVGTKQRTSIPCVYGPSLQASLEVTVPDCGYYGLFRFREAVWKVDGVYQRDDCFRGNRTNPFLFNDHLPNCTYRKIITRPISPGNKTASFSHMRHQRLPPSSPFAV